MESILKCQSNECFICDDAAAEQPSIYVGSIWDNGSWHFI